MHTSTLLICEFSDLPDICFITPQAKQIQGIVRYQRHEWPLIEQSVRINYTGFKPPELLDGIVLELTSVPFHLSITYNESHQVVKFGKGSRFLFGGWDVNFNGSDAQLLVANDVIAVMARCELFANSLIQIGDDCLLSIVQMMAGATHQLIDVDRGEMLINERPMIVLREHVWLAQDVIVQANTKVSIGSIVATKSVVQGSFSKHSLIVGHPAKQVKSNISWSRHYLGQDLEFYNIIGINEVASRLKRLEQNIKWTE